MVGDSQHSALGTNSRHLASDGSAADRSLPPADFMLRLENHEVANLKSQIVTSSWGGSRKPPHAFTEQGVAMLSSVLNSPQAIRVNIEIMRGRPPGR